METWQWTTLILCGFGLFKEFRPSEPFVTEYLIQYKNFTKDVIVHDAYPVSTYSYLGTLAIVFLVTDFLRYRSVVIFEGICYVTVWALLVWGQGLPTLIVLEVVYGLTASTEVAYYTYIYAKVSKDKYKRVTSYTYSAIFLGRFLAGLAAQILVSNDWMDYLELHYLSLASMILAFLFTLLLPGVKQSVYFYRDDKIGENPDETGENGDNNSTKGPVKHLTFVQRVRRAYPVLWKDFTLAYSNGYIVKWTIWWTVAMAIYLQVMNYIQAMWETIASSKDNEIYNGAVEAVHTCLSTVLALGVGYVKVPWRKWGNSFLGVTTIMGGVALIVVSQTKELFVAYACYIVFRTIFQVTITVASAEVAEEITEDSHGLVFGINTFLALAFQSILTLVVTDRKGLALAEPEQFLVYGCIFGALGILYIFIAAFVFGKYGCTSEDQSGGGGGSTEDILQD